MSNLEGKRVLITGGAQGIGLHMAALFGKRGAEAVLADINEGKVAEAAAGLESQGIKAWGFPVDVTDPASTADLRARVAAEAGPIDVLVNNAGVVFGGPFTKTPLEQHLKTYAVNVTGLVTMTHTFLDDLVQRPDAHLVHIASASGLIGLPYGSTYASSKWAVIGFGESIRAELNLQGHKHVRHTIVCPSYIGTGMFDGAEAPKATSVLEPEYLAEKVVHAVERNQVYVLEPFMVKLTPIIKAMLPLGLYDRISHLFGADTSMAHWTGHSPGGHQPEASEDTSASVAPRGDQAEADR
jgi:short-subunit dehydrogenase